MSPWLGMDSWVELILRFRFDRLPAADSGRALVREVRLGAGDAGAARHGSAG